MYRFVFAATPVVEPQVTRRPPRASARRLPAHVAWHTCSMAPLRNRRKVDGEVLMSRIAEGFTRFEWNGMSGRGMTEYIERVEDDALAGYPL